MVADGAREMRAKRLAVLVVRLQASLAGPVECPVASDSRALMANHHAMSGRKLQQVLIKGGRRIELGPAKKVGHLGFVDPTRYHLQTQQRPNLGSECEEPSGAVVVERL